MARVVDAVYYTTQGRRKLGDAEVFLAEDGSIGIKVNLLEARGLMTGADVMSVIESTPTEIAFRRKELDYGRILQSHGE